ncbi:hypothetical protein DPMN_148118 [Dreissena polymorpha]|uniref:Uncharacterized protein n=1 Tax=Dreissena polymorpha TaxID=45954 RepID=A0A9D4FB44_DREPO|nr:hypothetical protein DPMN_148118 [Dreissena polymorpha]
MIPVSGWVQQTSITQREVFGWVRQRPSPNDGSADSCHNWEETVSATRADRDAPATGHWTPPEDRGSSVPRWAGHIGRRQRIEGQERVIRAAVGRTY